MQGSIFLADKLGDPSSVETLSAEFEGITDMVMEDHNAYVIDQEGYIWKFNFDGKRTDKTMISSSVKYP